ARELKDRLETQKIISTSVGGEHFINDWTVEYDLSMSKAEEDEPDSVDAAVFEGDFSDLSYSSTRKPVISGASDFYDASNYTLDEIERVKSYTTDEMTIVSLDLTRDMIVNDYPAMLKFGAKSSQREKDMDVDIRLYSGDDISMADYTSGSVDYDLVNFGPSLSASKLRSALNSLDEESDFVASYEEDYRIEEDINAAYFMGRIDMDELQIIAGVRYEATKTDSYGYAVDADNETASRTHYSNSYSHALPALLSKWEFAENTQLRGAITHSVVRPNFEHMRPSYTYDGEELVIGNPELKPMEARNFDLGIEHFVGEAGVVSAFGFYKDIDNFSYEVDGDEADYGDFAQGLAITTFKNGEKATVKGLELAFSRKFTSLPAPFNGLLMAANYTRVQASAQSIQGEYIRMQNLSDETGNVTLGYEDDRLNLRLAANYKSDYDNGDGIVQDQTQLDFNASYKVTSQLDVRFKAANLTNEVYYVYQDSSNYNVQYEEYGPTYTLGVSYNSF
ncbi:MAG: TonB-dependent receptor, partial [Oceanobacter sp.]